jgi:hypothetical protein
VPDASNCGTTFLDQGGLGDVVLIADPQVTAIPVRDNGEGLADVRDPGLRVSSYRAA